MKIKRHLVIAIAALFLLLNCNGHKNGSTGTNTPPKINNVVLSPLNPTVQTEISAQIIAMDKDGDPLTYEVQWFVNGRKIGEGMTFKYEDIKTGDQISAQVRASDGKNFSEPFKSGAITVGGLPPKIVSLSIVPESLFVTTPQVTVNALVEDPDQDSVTIICHWLINDNVLPETSNVLNLRSQNIKKKDIIIASAYAFDGALKSEAFPFELHIANSAPLFSTRIDSVKCNPESLYYKVPIFDPDNDPLEFELIQAPPGVYIDQGTGIIYGNAGDVRQIDVAVRAEDTEGAYLDAKFTLTAP